MDVQPSREIESEHGAIRGFDGNPKTWWTIPSNPDARYAMLLKFRKEYRIDSITIVNGVDVKEKKKEYNTIKDCTIIVCKDKYEVMKKEIRWSENHTNKKYTIGVSGNTIKVLVKSSYNEESLSLPYALSEILINDQKVIFDLYDEAYIRSIEQAIVNNDDKYFFNNIPNVSDKKTLDSLLDTSVKNGKVEYFEEIVRAGADPMIGVYYYIDKDDVVGLQKYLTKHEGLFGPLLANERIDTPLNYVLYTGKIQIAELLIKNNIPLNNKDSEYGNTPLHIACEKKYIGIVKLLIDHGAKTNVKNDKGLIPSL